MSSFAEKTLALTARVGRNNTWRQRECFNLIPSESTPSLLVKMCEISDPSGRYAEHRTMKGDEVYFYQGTDFIRDVEVEARAELAKFFGCGEVELRPVSGQMANEVVFKGMVKFINRGKAEGTPSRRLRLVMNNDLNKGGHLSSQPMGALFNFVEEDPATGKERVVHLPVLPDNPYKPDLPKLAEILQDHKPELIVFGKSMFIYQEPVRFVADIVKDWAEKPVLMFDMAHVLGLYGAFQEPLAEGANVVTGSTHKTFFGPQRGLVAGNFPQGTPLRNLWLDIKARAFPGSTSNHHLGTLLGLLMAAYEMNEFKAPLQKQVRANAKAFAGGPQGQGHPGRRRPARRVHRDPPGPHPGQAVRGRHGHRPPPRGEQHPDELPGPARRRDVPRLERHPDGRPGDDPVRHDGEGFRHAGRLRRRLRHPGRPSRTRSPPGGGISWR